MKKSTIIIITILLASTNIFSQETLMTINEEKISTNFIVEKRDIMVPYLDAERYLVKINN